MASNVDIRIDTAGKDAVYSADGLYKQFILSRRIDVPALIAAGTLAATGLVSTNSYYLFNLPKWSLVKGGFIFVRTVDAGGGTITVLAGSTTYATTLSLATAGLITDASGAGFAIANILAFNTGIGTDYVKITIASANVTTAIFDVCVEVLKGDQAYNAGSSGTGQ
jgi:hypothetical protein